MEMPNVQPQTLTQTLLEDKYQRGGKRVWPIIHFMGASNDNLESLENRSSTGL